MSTIADQLNELVSLRDALADNLSAKGQPSAHSDTLSALVPRVLNISGSLPLNAAAGTAVVTGEALSQNVGLTVTVPVNETVSNS